MFWATDTSISMSPALSKRHLLIYRTAAPGSVAPRAVFAGIKQGPNVVNDQVATKDNIGTLINGAKV